MSSILLPIPVGSANAELMSPLSDGASGQDLLAACLTQAALIHPLDHQNALHQARIGTASVLI